MVEYYSRLAPRYESKKGVGVPLAAEVQQHWSLLLKRFRPELEGKDVLELACGPGTWTHRLAPLVKSIVATDINERTLVEARKKSYPEGRVRFVVASAHDVSALDGDFDAGFAKDWCSHVPKETMCTFLQSFHARLLPGARVVMADAWYPDNERQHLSHVDVQGNIFVNAKFPARPTAASGQSSRTARPKPSAGSTSAMLPQM
jgi:ubiquinone/menaquinone biosynthesis C-methylase UbiE